MLTSTFCCLPQARTYLNYAVLLSTTGLEQSYSEALGKNPWRLMLLKSRLRPQWRGFGADWEGHVGTCDLNGAKFSDASFYKTLHTITFKLYRAISSVDSNVCEALAALEEEEKESEADRKRLFYAIRECCTTGYYLGKLWLPGCFFEGETSAFGVKLLSAWRSIQVSAMFGLKETAETSQMLVVLTLKDAETSALCRLKRRNGFTWYGLIII